MNILFDLVSNLVNVIISITVADIIDMVILSYLLYKGIKLVRETRAQQLLKGILLIVIAYFIAKLAMLKTITFLLEKFFQWGVLAVFILFQPELRRVLEKMGRTKMSKIGFSPFGNVVDESQVIKWKNAINTISEAASELSATVTGALIVIERQTRLGEQIDTGTIINATPSVAILGNIFFPNTPLHDGAVIIRNGMILAAGCFLPKPQKEELINKLLGSRHRAAIGMSENSDAIVIIVSEETGTISVAQDGELTRGFTKESLKKLLTSIIIPEDQPESKKKKKIEFKLFSGKVKNK